jgi:hypothetical protein
VDGHTIRSSFDFYQALNNASGRNMATKVFRQNEEIELALETK